MRDAEAVQARHEEEKDRVKAAANVSRRVSTWAGRKTLPQLLRSVHLLLPTLVPTQVGVATDGGGVKSVRPRQCFLNFVGIFCVRFALTLKLVQLFLFCRYDDCIMLF